MFPSATVSSDHKFSDLMKCKFILLQFWRLEVYKELPAFPLLGSRTCLILTSVPVVTSALILTLLLLSYEDPCDYRAPTPKFRYPSNSWSLIL
jgi:hypothetical protein